LAITKLLGGDYTAKDLLYDAVLGAVGGGAAAGLRRGARLPDNAAQLRHIFSARTAHLADTPANRKLLMDVANDRKSMLGKDKFGNVWHARTLDDGTQVWISTRNRVIQNGGLNDTPRVFDPQTGLSGGGQ
jgi:filamentous hemagglutinin